MIIVHWSENSTIVLLPIQLFISIVLRKVFAFIFTHFTHFIQLQKHSAAQEKVKFIIVY